MVTRMLGKSYFLPLPWCFAGSETCFLSFRFWSFSRCSFLCCSKPSAFFALLDKIFNLSQHYKTNGTQKPSPNHRGLSQYLIAKLFTLRWGSRKTPNVEICCPKCGSSAVVRSKNQECRCTVCGEIFYFVTPQCGSQTDLERYKL